MASPPSRKEAITQTQPITTMAVVAPALGWLIPGAGHLIQRRWIRGVLLLLSITTLSLLGLAMDGRIYKANGGDILDVVGVSGDLGAGGMYLVTLMQDWGRGAI